VPKIEHLLSGKKLKGEIDYYITSIRSEGKSRKTIRTYSDTLYRFANFVGHDDITPTDVRSYLLSLQEAGLKPHSVHVHYRNLKTFFTWMGNDGIYKTSPMVHVKPPKLPRLVIRPFSKQDIENIMPVVSGSRFVDIRNKAIVLILLDTGIRLGELAGLEMKDISLEQDILTD
jgi:integrase/recombinase XerC